MSETGICIIRFTKIPLQFAHRKFDNSFNLTGSTIKHLLPKRPQVEQQVEQRQSETGSYTAFDVRVENIRYPLFVVIPPSVSQNLPRSVKS